MTVYSAGQTSISTSATAIFSGWVTGSQLPQVSVKNLGPETVFVGSSSVTTSTGYPLLPGDEHTQTMIGGAGSSLYGITTGGTSTVAFLFGE